MTIDELQGKANLRELGFTYRQAEFLYLVGTNTGVFTMDHYRTFAGIKSGKACMSLMDRLCALKFVTRIAIEDRLFIIHIDHKGFYRAILTPDSRLRRRMSWGIIRQRLQFMDYIARNPEAQYLSTERSRREIIPAQFGVSERVFPAKVFISQKNKSSTTRFFPARFPMFIRETATDVSLGVVYGEDPAFTFQAFRKFVFAHCAFLDQIPCLYFVYISPFQRRRELAMSFLTTYLGRSRAVIDTELSRYFGLLKLFDEKREREFTDADYAFWDRAYRRFKGPEYDALYAHFRAGRSLDSFSCARPVRTFECATFSPTTTLRRGFDT
jgi:hypothetical protein